MKKLLSILASVVAIVALFGVTTLSAATPTDRSVKVIVMPDHLDWNYKCGEKPSFRVLVLKHHSLMQNVEISYELSEDQMPARKSGKMVLKAGEGHISLGETMKVPGFLRCAVTVKDGHYTYTGLATAGFDVEKIKPTVTNPADFDEFWKKALEESAKIPMQPKLTPAPEFSTGTYTAYYIQYQTYKKNVYFHGLLTVPTKPGKHPAILRVPGAGVRSYTPMTELDLANYVSLQVGIHGIPVNLPKEAYKNLSRGALYQYNRFNIQDRDAYYYKRVYIGCARAIDFLSELECVDAERIGVCGHSQGGALTFVTTYLNPKVKFYYAHYPALADMTGYLHGRGGGWPHIWRNGADQNIDKAAAKTTIPYYDVVNFARRVNVPGVMACGYNDTTCCPTSMFSVYNVISSPKELALYNEIGHWLYEEQENDRRIWFNKKFLK